MNSRTTLFAITLAFVLVSTMASPMPAPWELPSLGDIGGGLLSTGRIIAKMCNADNVDDEVAQKYYDCYSETPYDGKEIFGKCQQSSYGYQLNTAANWKLACRAVTSLPSYAMCLRTEFKAIAVDLEKTMEVVNKCEAKVLGME